MAKAGANTACFFLGSRQTAAVAGRFCRVILDLTIQIRIGASVILFKEETAV
jgi:hypothetical protein